MCGENSELFLVFLNIQKGSQAMEALPLLLADARIGETNTAKTPATLC